MTNDNDKSASERLRPLMIGGSGSDVGKSVIVTGLCRIFLQDGYHPAPFKAQNMALNSFITPDGLEIGRAQAVQAEAAGLECQSDMNPVLLKPIADSVSQVIINGKVAGNRRAKEYFSAVGREHLRQEVHGAFDRLQSKYNPIVMEGAGSIAELNLLHLDIVNMPMAKYVDAAVILVCDINRGGVFASAYGSIMLLPEEYRKLIKGIIINKFRGDASLFDDGRRILEQICGVPVIGVLPYMPDLKIEEEDSYFYKKHSSKNPTNEDDTEENKEDAKDEEDDVRVESRVYDDLRDINKGLQSKLKGKIKIAVVRLSHISNFTDFDPLENHPDVNLFYTLDPKKISESDIIILPGTKATISDLQEIKENGVAQAVIQAHDRGKHIVGICGGYQMLGERITDPDGIEGKISSIEGLGLIPAITKITPSKVTRRTGFSPYGTTDKCTGYEIHMGRTSFRSTIVPFATLEDGTEDGYCIDSTCIGTYLHGLFENKVVIDNLLAPFTNRSDEDDFDYRAFKESQYDRLASEMRKHLNTDLLYQIMRREV